MAGGVALAVNLDELPKAEGAMSLPPGWVLATLDYLTGSNGLMIDGDWVESKDQDPSGEVRLIQLADIGDGYFLDKSNRFLNTQTAERLRCTFLRKNDVLIARMAFPLGRACIYPGLSRPAVTVVDVCIWRTNQDLVEPRWLMHTINALQCRKAILSESSGTTRQRISGGKLKKVPIALPPLAEQRRIVARVDALISEIDEGMAALDAARKSLDTFRRALLKAAVSGELTKDWRTTNVVSETGQDLLNSIINESVARRVSEDRVSRDAPVLDPSALPALPGGWVWATVNDLLEFVTSGSRGWKEYYSDNGAIFVRAQNINSGVLDLSDVAFVQLPTGAEGLRTRLKVADVLVTITGANVTVSARVTQDLPEAYVNQHVALLRPILPQTSEFLLLWLQADGAGKSQLVDAAYGAGKPGLNLGNIRNVSIALPPPAEAAEILRRVSAALAAGADTLAMLDAEAGDAARLKQSILKAACEGRLLTQDPTDEPASLLLARLQITHATAKPAKRGRRAK
jgi:type I restriction enzyme S subunit